MNRLEKEMIKRASDDFQVIGRILPCACLTLNYKFEITSPYDGETMDFSIDGIPFSIGWDVVQVKGLGSIERPVVKYQLFTFNFVHATRWQPEEWYDVELVNNATIYECMKKALTTVAENAIRCALESASFSMTEEYMQDEAQQYIEHV